MALKSTEQERQLLRARSAVQRFPVVEWRQRTEDFHSRSITASRSIAGSKAWRKADGESGPLRPIADHDDWNPIHQDDPSQPDWDRQSYMNSPRMGGGSLPGSPDPTTPGTGTDFLQAPHMRNPDSRSSVASDMSEDYFVQRRGSTMNNGSLGSPGTPGQDYGHFLDRANKQIARDKKHVPDPFLEPGMAPPTRPFGAHSRVSSVESISSIVDEKQNSPLNKAIASVSLSVFLCYPLLSSMLFQFTDADGGVASEFVAKLQGLNSTNSKHELSIEKFLTKSEEAFFDKVKKDKLSSAASIRSSQRDSVWGTPSSFDYSRPSCRNSPCHTICLTLTYPLSAPSLAPSTGLTGTTPDVPPEEVVIMTGLQIAMSREFFGWPLYSLVMAAGQVCRLHDTCLPFNDRLAFLDAKRNEFPNYPLVRSKLAE